MRCRIPDDQPLATLSINRGVPLVVSHRRSALARAIRKLARQLMEDLPAVGAAVEPEGRSTRQWIRRPATA
ncbi:MAG: hypothetical protein FJ026_05730 [Chloroflexi bacterium]|nr:hypothetical protein [Chloroflexota bacterium]